MEKQPYGSFAVAFFVVVSLFIGGVLGFMGGKTFGIPLPRSAVYEIPMADRREPWRVTTYRNKVYVLIEAPSMPEDIARKDGPTR